MSWHELSPRDLILLNLHMYAERPSFHDPRDPADVPELDWSADDADAERLAALDLPDDDTDLPF